MKIQRIICDNFRGIKRVELSGLGNMVIIAGPNGCGKSSIFDAIRFFKTYYGTYEQNELSQLHSEFQLAKPQSVGVISTESIAQDPSKQVEIELHVVLEEVEKDFIRSNVFDIAFQEVFASSFSRANIDLDQGSLSVAISQQQLDNLNNFALQKSRAVTPELSRPYVAGKIVIDTKGRTIKTSSPLMELMFSNFYPENLGIIDFTSANRQFGRQQFGAFNFNRSQINQQIRSTTLYNTSGKYNQITQELGASYIRSLLEKARLGDNAEAQQNNLWDSIHELFRLFFPDKTFSGPTFDDNGNLAFFVETSDGFTHDLNELSSGEKEIVLGYLRLYNSTPRNSVILVDEPELHLNPRLIKELPEFYERNVGRQFGNQIWLITHSDALLRRAVSRLDFSVFHMVPSFQIKVGGNQVLKLDDENLETAIIGLVGEISSYSPGSKVLLLEGQDTKFDEDMITTLFPRLSSKLSLVSVGSKSNVKHLHDVLDIASKEAGIATRFYSIVDRDFDDEGLDRLPSTNRFKWDVYHIENYLLSNQYILRATKFLKTDSPFIDESLVEEALKRCAEAAINKLVNHNLIVFITNKLNPITNIGVSPQENNPAPNLASQIGNKTQLLSEIASGELGLNALERKAEEIRQSYRDSLRDETWKSQIPGRPILKSFVNRHVIVGGSGVSYEAFVNVVLSTMAMDGWQPEGMLEVLNKIEPTLFQDSV